MGHTHSQRRKGNSESVEGLGSERESEQLTKQNGSFRKVC